MKITTSDVHKFMLRGFDDFKYLKSKKPSNYPHHPDYEITTDKMEWYVTNRTMMTWDHMNLPMALYSYQCGEEFRAKPFAKSALQNFDRFCKEFGDLPGAGKLLGPLWNSAWDMGDACFWSALSEATLSLFLKDKGFPVFGFEQVIGDGKKRCDIQTEFNSKRVNMDVEVKHINFELRDNPDDLRGLVEGYALKKMEDKFKCLPANEFGVIGQVYMLHGENLNVFKKHEALMGPVHYKDRVNQFTRIYWIVGGTMDGVFAIYIQDNGGKK